MFMNNIEPKTPSDASEIQLTGKNPSKMTEIR